MYCLCTLINMLDIDAKSPWAKIDVTVKGG